MPPVRTYRSGGGEESMTRDAMLAFCDRRVDAWKRRDPVALASDHTEQGTVVSPIFSKIKGRDAIQRSYESLFQSFPDWSMNNEPPLIDGERVAVPFMAKATHAGRFMGLDGTGRRCEIHGILLMEMRDGLIGNERRIYDFTGLLIQLGVLRSKPGV
jgi:predicted ester cyclase